MIQQLQSALKTIPTKRCSIPQAVAKTILDETYDELNQKD